MDKKYTERLKKIIGVKLPQKKNLNKRKTIAYMHSVFEKMHIIDGTDRSNKNV